MDFLRNLLLGIIEFVLQPLLTSFIPQIFELLWNLVKVILSEFIVQFLGDVLAVLDFIIGIFDVFAGLRDVTYTYVGNDSNFVLLNGVSVIDGNPGVIKTKIMDLMLGYKPFTEAFWFMAIVAAGLTILFTIFSVYKTIGGAALSSNDKEPLTIGKTLGSAVKSGLTILLVPAMMFLLLNITNIILAHVDNLITITTGEQAPSVGTVLFLLGTFGAEKTKVANAGFTDEIRGHYYRQEDGYDYMNIDQIKKDFDIDNYDIITVGATAVFTCFIIGCTLLLFVRRIFEILVLYIVAPFFAATIPLDEGKTFGKWKEMFVAKFCAGFGVIIIFKIFYMVFPTIVNSDIKFDESSSKVDYIIKVFIVLGGFWAAFQSQHLILQMLSYEAGIAAQESTSSFLGGFFKSSGGGGGGGDSSSANAARNRNAAAQSGSK